MFEDLLNQQEFVDQVEQTDPSLNPKDIEMVLESASSFGVYILVISIAAIVLGIVSMFLFKGNNKPKAAGIILIVVGGLSTLLTIGFGIFAGIFYIIAGIMGVARKPKQEVSLEQY